MVGFASGHWGRPDPAHLAMHNYSLLGVMPGGYDRAFKERAQAALMALWERGAIRVPVHRTWSTESILGYLYSTTFAAPHLFAGRLDEFETMLKAALAEHSTEDVFPEDNEFLIRIGRRDAE